MERTEEEAAKPGSYITIPMAPTLPSFAKWAIRRCLFVERLNEICAAVCRDESSLHVMTKVLKVFDIKLEISEMDRARIPKDGPVIVVANHPFGAIEGIILSSILCSVRADARIMANYLLKHIHLPGFQDVFLYVDPFGTKESTKANVAALREAVRLVKSGGMLGVFPAGEVSHFHISKMGITDPKWSNTVARLVRKSEAPVLPIFFNGSNSIVFQMLGLLHPRLRTAMLSREMLNKSHKRLEVRVGKLIAFDKLRNFEKDESLTEYLRLRTYILSKRTEQGKKPKGFNWMWTRPRRCQTIAPPQDPEVLTEEVLALPREQVLVDTKEFSVFCANADQIPHLLLEIGRMREITFREAGEGTGKSIDIDRFDDHYKHLFLWNKEKGEVAGGYRLGLTDRICRKYGTEGLYTSTLFEYATPFLERIQPAIEVGRSFVRSEYQKTYQPLLLLWKGIGQFVRQNPRYKILFGPVSVDRSYHSISRKLIVAFSRQNRFRPDLARFVRSLENIPKGSTGGRGLTKTCALLQDIRDLSELISEIERDEKGVPVLLKHYMKLGGEFLGFTIDHNFNDTLDILILVDLTRTNPKTLERYLGKEGTAAFLKYHNESPLEARRRAAADVVE